jgi:DNA invertase Pin-like site-specific DNA recombinase
MTRVIDAGLVTHPSACDRFALDAGRADTNGIGMAKRICPGNPLVAIGYVRCSTDDQHLGPQAQRAALEAWAIRTGVTLVAVFEDQGVSGATPVAERPRMLAALEALRTHGAGLLVAAKRDRFARDAMVAAMVERSAASMGAVVRTSDGSSDIAGPEGVMMRGIVDVFAAYEREVIRARTRAALGVKKARGERVGEVTYGFRLAADGVHLELDAAEQGVLAAVHELRAAGMSQRAIVAELAARGLVSRSGRPFQKTQIFACSRGPHESGRRHSACASSAGGARQPRPALSVAATSRGAGAAARVTGRRGRGARTWS